MLSKNTRSDADKQNNFLHSSVRVVFKTEQKLLFEKKHPVLKIVSRTVIETKRLLPLQLFNQLIFDRRFSRNHFLSVIVRNGH
jgi:hypothetical protein